MLALSSISCAKATMPPWKRGRRGSHTHWLKVRSIISDHNGTAHSKESRNITVNIAQSTAAPMGSSSYICLNSIPILCHKLWGLLCASPARPPARSARPKFEPIILKWKLPPSRNKRDDKFIAHSDGFELMKIIDIENNPLTNAKQQGHTNPSRLRTDWVDLTPVPSQ